MPSVVHDFKLDRHTDRKIYFGRHKLQLTLNKMLDDTLLTGRQVAIQNTTRFLLPFYFSNRASLLGPTHKKWRDLNYASVISLPLQSPLFRPELLGPGARRFEDLCAWLYGLEASISNEAAQGNRQTLFLFLHLTFETEPHQYRHWHPTELRHHRGIIHAQRAIRPHGTSHGTLVLAQMFQKEVRGQLAVLRVSVLASFNE